MLHTPFFLRLLRAGHCCLFIALWWVAAGGAHAGGEAPATPQLPAPPGRTLAVLAPASAAPLSLTPWFDVLEDPSGQLSLEDVRSPTVAARFAPSGHAGEALNFGLTPSTWWLRLTLDNPGQAAQPRWLEVAYARLSRLDFYTQRSDGSWRVVQTGTTAAFDSRGYPHRYFVQDVSLPPHTTQTLYLRIASTTAFIVPARLWQPDEFRAYERSDYAVQSGYFGMVAAMVLFNLLLFVRLKDWLYLQYVGFTLSLAFALAAQNGLVKEVFRLASPLWSDLCTSFGYSFALATGMLFLRGMLEMHHRLPRLDPWLRGFIAFFLLSPLLFLVTGQALIQAAAVTYLLAMLTMLGLAIYSAWQRQHSAYFFLAAFGMLGLGAVTNVLRAMGLLPTNVLTANAMQVGSALEMLLLALALADRFSQMRRDKTAMQTELLITQRSLINSLRSNEQRLEEHVTERTQALEEANNQLQALSRTDGLTGIANRRRFDEVLASEWARAKRSGEPLALAMLDIDWFKAYNDRCGHPAGDECLRSVAGVLSRCATRSTDLVARYGGEEFAIISPNTTAAQMQALAQLIQQALATLALPHPGAASGRVTLCIGIASHIPQARDTADQLVTAADQALYQAKASGRNLVEIADPAEHL